MRKIKLNELQINSPTNDRVEAVAAVFLLPLKDLFEENTLFIHHSTAIEVNDSERKKKRNFFIILV